MKSGVISYKIQKKENKSMSSLFVSSNDSNVYSLTAGEVRMAMKVTSIYNCKYNVVMVKFTDDSVISYSELGELYVKKGDLLTKGQLIGKALAETKSGKNEIGVSLGFMSKAKGYSKILPDPEVMAFINETDY
jgi:hypothetical protein